MTDLPSLAIAHVQATQDPVYLGMLWILGVMVVIIMIANVVTNLSQSKARGERAGAEGHLYSQLSEQANRHAKALDEAYKERNEKIDREVAVLMTQVKNLASKLDDKDLQIMLRDRRMQDLFDVIMVKDKALAELKERVHTLELRLAMDESAWCRECDKRQSALTTLRSPKIEKQTLDTP